MNDDRFLDARSYGFSERNAGAQNAAALTKAVLTAVVANKVLLIAAGTFDIDINNTQNTGADPVNGTVTIRGSGQGHTILRAANYDSSLGAALLRVAPGRFDVTVEAITLQGPPAVSMTRDDEACWGIWIGGGGTVRLDHVRAFDMVTGVYSVRIEGGTAIIDSCTMAGTKPIYVDTFLGAATLELWNNRWSGNASTEINLPGARTIMIGEKATASTNPRQVKVKASPSLVRQALPICWVTSNAAEVLAVTTTPRTLLP